MGTYSGGNDNDTISGGYVSAGVVGIPTGSSPTEEADTLDGGGGDDRLEGEGGNDTIYGGTGQDNAYGEAGDDLLYGGDDDDWLRGGKGKDTINGEAGNDHAIEGGDGDDSLYGGDGGDNITGGRGNDILNGGGGKDHLDSGTGEDRFDFDAASDSVAGEARDVLEDFEAGADKIDVSAIDANTDLDGHQAFAFISTSAPTGPAQINMLDEAAGGETIVQMNVDGDLEPEAEIEIDDGYSISASSYKESDFTLGAGGPVGGRGESGKQSVVEDPPEITAYDTFQEGDLIFLRLHYTDPDRDAEGFGFRGINGSGWAEETHPFSDPSYGRVSPGTVAYPFNHLATTDSAFESDVEAWIYDEKGLRSDSVTIHLSGSSTDQKEVTEPIPTDEVPFFILGGSNDLDPIGGTAM